MCHQSVRPDARPQSPSPQGGRDGEGQGQPDLDPDPDPDPPQGDTGPGLSPPGDEQSGNHGNGGSAAEEIYGCPSEGEEEEEEEEDGSDNDLNTEAVQGLCFSSSGDFVGFAAPGWSCPPVGRPSASVPWDGSLPGGVEEEEEIRDNRPSGAGDSGLADTEESLPPPPPPPPPVGRAGGVEGGPGGGVEGGPGGGEEEEERGRPSADPRMNAPPCAAPGNRTVPSHGPAGGEHPGGESPSVTEPDSPCGEEPDLEEAQ